MRKHGGNFLGPSIPGRHRTFTSGLGRRSLGLDHGDVHSYPKRIGSKPRELREGRALSKEAGRASSKDSSDNGNDATAARAEQTERDPGCFEKAAELAKKHDLPIHLVRTA